MLLHTHAHVCIMHTLENISSIHVVSRIGAREKFFEISGRVEIRNGRTIPSARQYIRSGIQGSVTGALYSLRLVVGAVVEAGPGHLGGCILDGSTDENQLGKLTGEKRGRELFPPERALTPCSHSGENVSRIHECQRESRIRNGRRSNGQKTFCSLR